MEFTFFYLATPYSKYPHGPVRAFDDACELAATLIGADIPVFSPIVHSHPIAETGKLDAFDHSLWMAIDKPFLKAASALIVARMDGWESSLGIKKEINLFNVANKHIVYIDPWQPDIQRLRNLKDALSPNF